MVQSFPKINRLFIIFPIFVKINHFNKPFNCFSMKKKMYFLLLLAFVGLCTPAKAVLVNIPDANFRARLQTLYPACFVGVQMETTCVGITSATLLTISGLNITNLSGIEYFVNLQILECNSIPLINLPILPVSLIALYCSNNPLMTLPALPPNLRELFWANNQSLTLPILPNSLLVLACPDNQLTSLPTLPTTLNKLVCTRNQLTSLPTLPGTLNDLTCASNQLTSLPTLPSGLQRLWCDFNKLTSLPPMPLTTTDLICKSNLLSFSDLEAAIRPNTSYQASPQNYTIIPATQTLSSGNTLTINGGIGGSANVYQWIKNGSIIFGATSAVYSKANITDADAGLYRCIVTSTSIAGVSILSSNVIICTNVTITNTSLPNVNRNCLGSLPNNWLICVYL